MDCSTPGFPVHHQLRELTQTHVHWVGDAIQPSPPLSSPSPPAFNLSQHQVFSKESALCISWSKCWSFSFSISPSNEYCGVWYWPGGMWYLLTYVRSPSCPAGGIWGWKESVLVQDGAKLCGLPSLDWRVKIICKRAIKWLDYLARVLLCHAKVRKSPRIGPPWQPSG